MNQNWRYPNYSEAQIVTDWKLKTLRDRRKILIIFAAILLFVPLSVVIISLLGWFDIRIVMKELLLSAVASIIFLFLFSDVYRKRQILHGEYQIVDAVVSVAYRESSGPFILKINADSGECVNLTVTKAIFDTIVPNTPGYLIRYGKNTAFRKAKPAEFCPLQPADEHSYESTDMPLRSTWRLPNTSEADRIAAWTRKLIRADRPTLIALTTLLSLIPLSLVILTLIGHMGIGEFLPYGLISVLMTIFLVRVGLTDKRKHKQLTSGDYQILDAVIVSKICPQSGRVSNFFVQAKTPTGEILNVKVHKTIFNAVTSDTPGYLLRYHKDPALRKDPTPEFFPRLRLDE